MSWPSWDVSGHCAAWMRRLPCWRIGQPGPPRRLVRDPDGRPEARAALPDRPKSLVDENEPTNVNCRSWATLISANRRASRARAGRTDPCRPVRAPFVRRVAPLQPPAHGHPTGGDDARTVDEPGTQDPRLSSRLPEAEHVPAIHPGDRAAVRHQEHEDGV